MCLEPPIECVRTPTIYAVECVVGSGRWVMSDRLLTIPANVECRRAA